MTSRYSFDRSLKDIEKSILRMGKLVEQSIHDSVQSLLKLDSEGASRIIKGDDAIDQLYSETEDKCMKMMATQQPMAKDLRILMTGIKILINLERMADYAVDIARVTIELGGYPTNIKPLEYIGNMGAITEKMLKDGLDAYVHFDVEKAGAMCRLDDEVDRIFSEAFKELVVRMQEDPNVVVQSAYSLFAGRYLERIADHATNIGEEVIYIATGERMELN